MLSYVNIQLYVDCPSPFTQSGILSHLDRITDTVLQCQALNGTQYCHIYNKHAGETICQYITQQLISKFIKRLSDN